MTLSFKTKHNSFVSCYGGSVVHFALIHCHSVTTFIAHAYIMDNKHRQLPSYDCTVTTIIPNFLHCVLCVQIR